MRVRDFYSFHLAIQYTLFHKNNKYIKAQNDRKSRTNEEQYSQLAHIAK